jgi:hypothetical protein
MDKLEKVRAEFMVMFGTRQSIAPGRHFADLVIGGLLVALAIGGFAMYSLMKPISIHPPDRRQGANTALSFVIPYRSKRLCPRQRGPIA